MILFITKGNMLIIFLVYVNKKINTVSAYGLHSYI